MMTATSGKKEDILVFGAGFGKLYFLEINSYPH